MHKANLSWLFILNVFLLITAVVSLARPSLVQSALAGHVVISEIQGGAAGETTHDFIEIYNPTDTTINLDGMRLVKRAGGDTSDDENIVAFTSGDSIPSHGYMLWCNTALQATLNCDKSSADIVSNNNSVAIRNGALNSGAIVDAVSFGTVTNTLGEGTSLTFPDPGQSVERKANAGSTADSMSSGADVSGGNGEDTDNNSTDFITRSASQPQNASASTETPTASPNPSSSPSASASPVASASPSVSPSAEPSASPLPSAESSESPSPSPSPSAIPSASPSTSPSASPSVSPSLSPSPSVSPSPNPSVSPSASPSIFPSPSPSPSVLPSTTPSPSVTPSPSIVPSPSASPSTVPTPTPKPVRRFSCEFTPKTIKIGRWEFTFMNITCSWKTV